MTSRVILYRKKTILIFRLCILGLLMSNTGLCFADSTETFGDVTLYNGVPDASIISKLIFQTEEHSFLTDPESIAYRRAATPRPTSVVIKINFLYDSVAINVDSLPYLDALGEMLNLNRLKTKSLLIEGHTDASGDANYNLLLSKARAETIKLYLQRVHSINPNRLYTMGHGESRLLDQDSPESDINRRVEFSPR